MTNKEKTIYARYVIELFEDDIDGRAGVGIKDHKYISDSIPKDKQKAVKYVINKISSNFPLLLLSMADTKKRTLQ